MHKKTPSIGILLVNLGTPDAPTPKAVRAYLAEFLWDRRVVGIPRLLWWLILHGLILRIRPRRSATAYQSIWTDAGSPLLVYSKRLAAALQQKFSSSGIQVELAMRYGSPSIIDGLQRLKEKNAQRILMLPLYPQYCATTTASVFDAVADCFKDMRFIPELRTINQYCDDTHYIDAVAKQISNHWQNHGKGEHLLFSFHGLPQRNFDLGDPYYCFCHKTTRLVAEQLGLCQDDYTLVFQSRFGKAKWLQPYCESTLISLAENGVKQVDVICPGFAADCLETLEEISIRYGERFVTAGGERLNYIPALNDSDAHIEALFALLNRHLCGWA